MSASGVEDDRQVIAFRQTQLRLQERNLALELRIFAIEIEANFPNRDQLSIAFRQAGFKPRQTLFFMPLNYYRMKPQGRVERSILRRKP